MSGLEAKASNAFLESLAGGSLWASQDLLGWAQPLDSGEPGGGWAEFGSTQQASLEAAAGSW